MQHTHTFFVESFDGEQLSVTEWKLHEHPTLTIVFLGGLGSVAEAWEYVISQLPELPIRCIGFDLRGHGRSSRCFPKSCSSPQETSARDLDAVLRHTGSEQLFLVGHSFGGMVIQEYLHHSQNTHTPFLLIASTTQLPNCSVVPRLWYSLLCKYSARARAHAFLPNKQFLEKWKNSFDFSPGRTFGDMRHLGFVPFILLWFSNLGWRVADEQLFSTQHAHVLYTTRDLVVNPYLQGHLHRAYHHLHEFSVASNHNAPVNHSAECAQVIGQLAAQYAGAGSPTFQTNFLPPSQSAAPLRAW